jgi:hypothetical protein
MNPGPCLKLSPVRDTPGVLGTEGVPYTRENSQQPLGHINHRCGQVTITWCLVASGTTGGRACLYWRNKGDLRGCSLQAEDQFQEGFTSPTVRRVPVWVMPARSAPVPAGGMAVPEVSRIMTDAASSGRLAC